MTERKRDTFVVVAGPCVLEESSALYEIAVELAQWGEAHDDAAVAFKGSYDKANRAYRWSPRGPGLRRGLDLLDQVRRGYELPVLTDVHTVEEARLAGTVCDGLQIPAALCRQTDLIVAAAESTRWLNLKKGQWVGRTTMHGAMLKARAGLGAEARVSVTERGTFFGYGDLVVDMRNITRLQQELLGADVLFDGTHSVQRPEGGAGGSSGGDRTMTRPLVLAAVAAGADGVYLETHPEPDRSLSDGESLVPLADLSRLLDDALAVWRTVRTS